MALVIYLMGPKLSIAGSLTFLEALSWVGKGEPVGDILGPMFSWFALWLTRESEKGNKPWRGVGSSRLCSSMLFSHISASCYLPSVSSLRRGRRESMTMMMDDHDG
jgi:hypothetical protein